MRMGEHLDSKRPSGGFADLVDYRLTRWEEDLAEVRVELDGRHLNRQGLLHGGVMTTILDAVLGYCGIYTTIAERDRRCLTLSLTCNFVGSAKSGDSVIAVARRSGGGQSVFFAAAEARDQTGRLLGTAEGVFKYRGDSGKSDAAYRAG